MTQIFTCQLALLWSQEKSQSQSLLINIFTVKIILIFFGDKKSMQRFRKIYRKFLCDMRSFHSNIQQTAHNVKYKIYNVCIFSKRGGKGEFIIVIIFWLLHHSKYFKEYKENYQLQFLINQQLCLPNIFAQTMCLFFVFVQPSIRASCTFNEEFQYWLGLLNARHLHSVPLTITLLYGCSVSFQFMKLSSYLSQFELIFSDTVSNDLLKSKYIMPNAFPSATNFVILS